jgi:hypothetical protein
MNEIECPKCGGPNIHRPKGGQDCICRSCFHQFVSEAPAPVKESAVTKRSGTSLRERVIATVRGHAQDKRVLGGGGILVVLLLGIGLGRVFAGGGTSSPDLPVASPDGSTVTNATQASPDPLICSDAEVEMVNLTIAEFQPKWDSLSELGAAGVPLGPRFVLPATEGLQKLRSEFTEIEFPLCASLVQQLWLTAVSAEIHAHILFLQEEPVPQIQSAMQDAERFVLKFEEELQRVRSQELGTSSDDG